MQTSDQIPIKVYGQDGQFVHLSVPDTKFGQQFAEWLRVHDRYTPNAEKK